MCLNRYYRSQICIPDFSFFSPFRVCTQSSQDASSFLFSYSSQLARRRVTPGRAIKPLCVFSIRHHADFSLFRSPIYFPSELTRALRAKKGFLRVYPRHSSEVDLQHLVFHMPAIVGMVFDPRHSLHVCPRHVQVTVSRSRDIH